MPRTFPPEDQEPRGPSADMAPTGGKGLVGIQEFRRLKRENPTLEVHELWALVGYDAAERAAEACSAPWADGRASPREARYRRDPRPD